MKALGTYLQRQRAAHHPDWKPAEMARRVGVSGSTISRLENGQTERPSLELLGRLAPWYGVPAIDLWQRAGHIPPEDARSIAALLADLAPIEMVRLGLERGPWPEDIVLAVKTLLQREHPEPLW